MLIVVTYNQYMESQTFFFHMCKNPTLTRVCETRRATQIGRRPPRQIGRRPRWRRATHWARRRHAVPLAHARRVKDVPARQTRRSFPVMSSRQMGHGVPSPSAASPYSYSKICMRKICRSIMRITARYTTRMGKNAHTSSVSVGVIVARVFSKQKMSFPLPGRTGVLQRRAAHAAQRRRGVGAARD